MNITQDGDQITKSKILDILKESLIFANDTPRRKYGGKYKDSYELASQLGKLIKQLEK